MIIVGIDPGFSGAICLIESSNVATPSLFDMPILKGRRTELNLIGIRELLSRADHIFLEKAQSMPGQGISSTGRYLMSYGDIRGICVGLSKPYTEVRPHTWKSVMMRDMPKEKDASIIRVQQLFPDLLFRRKKDHHKADALLLAMYGVNYLTACKA